MKITVLKRRVDGVFKIKDLKIQKSPQLCPSIFIFSKKCWNNSIAILKYTKIVSGTINFETRIPDVNSEN